MVAKIKTFSFIGIDVALVDVEVKISAGMPAFIIVGLPDKAVGESKERIRAAITSTGISWPEKRITVNLAPADLPKEGSHFDLAIALGILTEMGILSREDTQDYFVLGELSLDGSVNKVSGIIAASIGANAQNKGIICPQECGSEARWAGDLDIIAAPDLISLINHLKGQQFLAKPQINQNIIELQYPDLSDIKGQENAKRALEIAAAGGHNMLMIGPPGTGKSMLATRLAGILPKLQNHEILETNIIHSISGKINDGKLITNRPYRDVHHSCSMPAMVGGGSRARPGEISLAHNGILFLDELAEFPRQVLDSLRQPLETGKVTISRAASHVTYPANFQLIAAMNPCRCGYLSDPSKACKKAPICGQDYKNRVSGPFLDRIDIVIEVPQIDIFNHLLGENFVKGESSKEVAKRVFNARKIQTNRYLEENSLNKINAKIDGKILEKYLRIDEKSKEILQQSVKKLGISMRGINRIFRVARTIADLENSAEINENHILEAISYRRQL